MQLTKVLTKIKSVFATQSEQQKLDDFITSKQPTSIGEVEHWIRVYDRRNAQQFLPHSSYHYR